MIRSIELGHDHGFVGLLLIPFAELDAHNLGTHVRRPVCRSSQSQGGSPDLTEQGGVRRQSSRPCREKACRHRHGNRSRRPTMPVYPLDAGNWMHRETFLTECGWIPRASRLQRTRNRAQKHSPRSAIRVRLEAECCETRQGCPRWWESCAWDYQFRTFPRKTPVPICAAMHIRSSSSLADPSRHPGGFEAR
jgi:hypothetical protein